jgi:hypothetical protein
MSTSEEEVPGPGTSNQGDSQPAQDIVPVNSLPPIFQYIKTYFDQWQKRIAK